VKIAALKGQLNPQFLERWYPLVASTLVGYCLADLLILNLRPAMLPTKAPPTKHAAPIIDHAPPRGGYNTITSKNIFNWDGTIPDALTPKGVPTKPGAEQIPVLSQLPLNLIGTIVHSKPEKSVASIELKSKNQSISVRIKAEIENMAEILKIERNKVIFRNLNNNQLEFIEIQAKSKLSFQGSSAISKATPSGDEEVKAVGSNQFALKRSDVLKYTNNLASLLQQARSAPHRNPQTGEIDGFTILDYQPGSIYEKLGLQRMDVLKNVNGEPVDSPAKAMELYNALKNSDKVSISIDRGGKSETLDYSITK
jgi:general secretion pathway protein C